MKTFKFIFRPFPNAFWDELLTEAETQQEADVELKRLFPSAIVMKSGPVYEGTEIIDNVIYVDFQARRKVA